jgi:peptidoglycan hydrolase-like protein with peptidoglycan-binding domain
MPAPISGNPVVPALRADELDVPLPLPSPSGPPPPPPRPSSPASIDAFVGKVEKSAEFKSLDPATQAAADAAMKGAATSEARRAIADLVTSPGFGKLSVDSQGAALQALLKDPANAGYSSDVRALVNNGGPYVNLGSGSAGPAVTDMQKKLKAAGFDPGDVDGKLGPKTLAAVKAYQQANGLKVDGIAGPETLGQLNNKRFSGLSGDSQKLELSKVSNFPADPGARETIEQLSQSPGFKQLSQADQTKLLNTIGGTNTAISRGERNAMTALLNDPKFTGSSAADQKAQLQKFLTDEPGLQGVLSPDPGQFDAKRAKYKVTGPVDVKSYDFKSGKADALKYEVEIDGKKVPVYMPKNPSPSLKYHTIDQLAKGLAALPKSSRDLVTAVNAEPQNNPDDAFWAKQYNTPNFHSYMTAGAAGVVNVYPTDPVQSQTFLDGSLIHETGHTLSQQKWGNDNDPRWKPWQDAMKADGVHASKYAKNAQGEDFAETLKLYQMVKGTPQEAEMRALMPERFKIIDGLLAGKN